MRLQIPLVTLDNNIMYLKLATKNVCDTRLKHQSHQGAIYIQLTFSLCGIVIYDWFLWL
jgi:hypothetical protein